MLFFKYNDILPGNPHIQEVLGMFYDDILRLYAELLNFATRNGMSRTAWVANESS